MDKKVKFWQHREKKAWQKAIFLPMSQLDIKSVFSKNLFFSIKRSMGT